MTKPTRAARRADEWTFDMPAGKATHVPTGLTFVLLPHTPEQPRQFDVMQEQGWRNTGLHKLPPDTVDRRQVQIDPQDANAPRHGAWHVMVNLDARQVAGDALAAVHGPFRAQEMLERIAHEAGERWIFRARLERGWPDGRRAI